MKKDNITFPDLIKADLRVGLVTEAKLVEGSSKLIELTVDMGADYGIVTIFTGMQKWYQPTDFQGKKFPFVANLEPKKMMGRESQGMILSLDNNSVPVLIPLPDDIEIGTAVL